MVDLPEHEGFFWAKLVRPERVPANEMALDWMSVDWEVVDVFDNNGEGDERFMVFVAGRDKPQSLAAFEWGPEVKRPPELAHGR